METGIRKLISLLLIIISTMSLHAADARSFRIGLFPIELQDSAGISGAQQYIIKTVYSELFGELEALFSSDVFFEVYKTSYAGAEVIGQYDESVLFENSSIFTIEDDVTAAYALRSDGLDMIIYGRFSHIDDLLIFELVRIDRDLGRSVLYSNIISKNRLASEIERMFRLVIEDITGMETGTLTIRQDEGYHVTVGIGDGIITTVSDEIFKVLPHGIYSFEFFIDTVSTGKRTVAVLDEVQELYIEPPAAAPKTRYISSLPMGADLRVNSIYLGSTPAVVTSASYPGYRTGLELELDGYELYRGSLPAGRLQETVYLRPDWMAFQGQVDRGRESFYTSLGSLILSLPISIFSGFMYDTTDLGYWNLLQLAGHATTAYFGIQTVTNLLDYYHRIY